jgi:uncharacterized protein YndB with AHSA1/START domain
MAVTPAQAFAAWAEGARLAQWFCPRPWHIPECTVDFRPGGGIDALMRGPDGTEVRHRSVFLEVLPARRIVFTDAYEHAWVPSAQPFITAIVDFEAAAENEGTRVSVTVHHWSEADMLRHREMGFEGAWAAVLAQMEETARTL